MDPTRASRAERQPATRGACAIRQRERAATNSTPRGAQTRRSRRIRATVGSSHRTRSLRVRDPAKVRGDRLDRVPPRHAVILDLVPREMAAHDRLYRGEAMRRHLRKEMMLDLKIEPAEE